MDDTCSEAEQLQATISYFRIEQGHDRAYAPVDHAVEQLRAKASAMGSSPAAGRGARKPIPAAKPVRAAKVAAGGGFAFDMNGGGDQRDADFER